MKHSRKKKERRKYPRVSLEGDLPARVLTPGTVPVDLSATGILLESPRPLTAKAVNTLRLELAPNRQLLIRGRVVRNYVYQLDRSAAGATSVKYRAAIEFLSLTDDDQRMLQSYINRIESKVKASLDTEDRVYDGPDRRRVNRIEAATGLTGQVALLLDFQMLQLSAGGMMVRLAAPLTMGSHHLFNITIDDKVLELQGLILDCTPMPSPREIPSYRAIVQFHDIQDDQRDLLQNFVGRRLADGS